jgi:predicted transcriptional regulator
MLGDGLECVGAGAASRGSASQESYTFGMKTAVSIPDDLFRRADELAERLGKSRSEVYREALVDYVERRDIAAVTSALNEIADDLAAEQAGLADHAARRALERTEW